MQYVSVDDLPATGVNTAINMMARVLAAQQNHEEDPEREALIIDLQPIDVWDEKAARALEEINTIYDTNFTAAQLVAFAEHQDDDGEIWDDWKEVDTDLLPETPDEMDDDVDFTWEEIQAIRQLEEEGIFHELLRVFA